MLKIDALKTAVERDMTAEAAKISTLKNSTEMKITEVRASGSAPEWIDNQVASIRKHASEAAQKIYRKNLQPLHDSIVSNELFYANTEYFLSTYPVEGGNELALIERAKNMSDSVLELAIQDTGAGGEKNAGRLSILLSEYGKRGLKGIDLSMINSPSQKEGLRLIAMTKGTLAMSEADILEISGATHERIAAARLTAGRLLEKAKPEPALT